MQKYRDSLQTSIHTQLKAWFDAHEPVPHREVCTLLHSIKGTSGTIGMPELSELARKLLEEAEAMTRGQWGEGELRAFLYPLIMDNYGYRQEGDVLLTSYLSEKNQIPADQPLVLILDDDVTLLRYMKEELEASGYFVIATVNPSQAIHYFHDIPPDCFILDLKIPETSGFEVMETLGERIRKRFIPTTIISVDTDRETRLQAFRMGADDFIPKPIDIEELLVRMERQLARKQQVDSLLFVDELTGAMNRKYADEAYKRLCFEQQRTGKNFSIAVLDLDYFKRVNDQFGHLTGDRVLQGFARFLRRNIRATDTLIRFGGEEFVLLLPQTTAEEAQAMLGRLLKEFAQFEFAQEPSRLTVTFSAGVAEVGDPEPEHFRRWFEAADSALYRAKENGRSRIEISGIDAEQPLRKLNIAIIDDDAIIRAMLSQSVGDSIGRMMPVDIRTYRDGEIFFADEWHAQRAPYLVILDGIMPKMDGLEVLERIRALPGSDLYTVIMLTGRTGESDIDRALRLGADDYLTKPFHMDELEARIKRLLRRVNG